MAAARLLEAIEERLLARLEEEEARRQAGRVDLIEHRAQLLEVVAAADVRDDRGAAHAAALELEQLTEGADHPGRDVVDAEVAAVLERRDGLGLARARVAGDDDE